MAHRTKGETAKPCHQLELDCSILRQWRPQEQLPKELVSRDERTLRQTAKTAPGVGRSPNHRSWAADLGCLGEDAAQIVQQDRRWHSHTYECNSEDIEKKEELRCVPFPQVPRGTQSELSKD